MDILNNKTVTSLLGGASVNVGLSHAQILGVFRQGEQKDDAGFVALSSLDGSDWAFVPPMRISFGTDFAISAGEKIEILYKVTI